MSINELPQPLTDCSPAEPVPATTDVVTEPSRAVVRCTGCGESVSPVVMLQRRRGKVVSLLGCPLCRRVVSGRAPRTASLPANELVATTLEELEVEWAHDVGVSGTLSARQRRLVRDLHQVYGLQRAATKSVDVSRFAATARSIREELYETGPRRLDGAPMSFTLDLGETAITKIERTIVRPKGDSPEPVRSITRALPVEDVAPVCPEQWRGLGAEGVPEPERPALAPGTSMTVEQHAALLARQTGRADV